MDTGPEIKLVSHLVRFQLANEKLSTDQLEVDHVFLSHYYSPEDRLRNLEDRREDPGDESDSASVVRKSMSAKTDQGVQFSPEVYSSAVIWFLLLLTNGLV